MRTMNSVVRQRFIDPAPIEAAAFGCAQDGWLGDVRTLGYAYES